MNGRIWNQMRGRAKNQGGKSREKLLTPTSNGTSTMIGCSSARTNFTFQINLLYDVVCFVCRQIINGINMNRDLAEKGNALHYRLMMDSCALPFWNEKMKVFEL